VRKSSSRGNVSKSLKNLDTSIFASGLGYYANWAATVVGTIRHFIPIWLASVGQEFQIFGAFKSNEG
jgi:hypothetical protein